MKAREQGVDINPTADVVQMAFVAPGAAGAPAFAAASWETDASSGIYYARALIGPGTNFVLAPGHYKVLVKVTDNPEVPVLIADSPIQVV